MKVVGRYMHLRDGSCIIVYLRSVELKCGWFSPWATTVTVSGTRIRKKTKHGRKSAGRVRRKERAGDLFEVQTEANGSPGSVFSGARHDTPDHRPISI